MDVATVISPIQLIIDDTLAAEEILDTEPIGHFLDRPHTLKHCRDALRPGLLASVGMELWSSQGGKDLYRRTVEKYEELKKKLKPQQLPEAVQKELNRIVK